MYMRFSSSFFFITELQIKPSRPHLALNVADIRFLLVRLPAWHVPELMSLSLVNKAFRATVYDTMAGTESIVRAYGLLEIAHIWSRESHLGYAAVHLSELCTNKTKH